MQSTDRSTGENSKKILISAIVTGQAAGLIMAVVVIIVFVLFLGKAPLYPVQVIGSTVFGQAALEGTHFGAVIAGLLIHQLGPSLGWGILFGVIAINFPIETTKKALVLGLVVGCISMVGPYVLVPYLMTTLHGVDFWNQEVPMLWDWAAHLVFGASFALYPTIKAKI
jgi:uncharacterized membrane protein